MEEGWKLEMKLHSYSIIMKEKNSHYFIPRKVLYIPFSIRKIPSEERLSCERLRMEGNRILKGPAVGPAYGGIY